MKTKALHILFALFTMGGMFAQDVTTVRANSTDISDNLDLQAVASIFGESADLEDFERRLNDPNLRISNLDLNGDNRVDYLRVVEVTENNTHLIILQSVLGIDTFQDVATIEVERDRYNNVTVQVVGDVYMYGPNYIYQPVYAVRPAIFNVFWVSTYRPYYSPWYWGYYPTYYSYWNPYPVYRYHRHVHVNVINVRNTYNYVTVRNSSRAVSLYNTRRHNAYERQYPNRSFTSRNSNATNRHDLIADRGNTGRSSSSRSNSNAYRASSSDRGRNNATVNNNGASRVSGGNTSVRSTPQSRQSAVSPARSSSTVRSSGTPARVTSPSRSSTTPARVSSPSRSSSTPARVSTPSRSSSTPARVSSPSRSSSAPARVSSPSRSSSAPARVSSPSRSSSSGTPSSSRGTRGQ